MGEVVSEVMAEIAEWSIEAKEEDNDRYFYHFNNVSLIERGLKNYVIGLERAPERRLSPNT